MVNRIYPPELQLNKANTSDTEAPFLDLHLSISNGFVSSKIYDKRDDFDFDIVNFPFLDGDVPRSTSYGVYISQLIQFARVSSHVADFNARNKSLTAKLLQQGYRYHRLRKTFSKFYRRHYELVSKFNVGLKTLLHQGLSEPEFYGDLIYKLKKNVGRADFSDQFRKIIVRYKRIGYNIDIMRQSACLVSNPITINNFASLFNCTPVGWASDSMMARLMKFTVKDASPAFCFIASTCKIRIQSKSTRTAQLPSEANVCSKLLSSLNPYPLILNHCVRQVVLLLFDN